MSASSMPYMAGSSLRHLLSSCFPQGLPEQFAAVFRKENLVGMLFYNDQGHAGNFLEDTESCLSFNSSSRSPSLLSCSRMRLENVAGTKYWIGITALERIGRDDEKRMKKFSKEFRDFIASFVDQDSSKKHSIHKVSDHSFLKNGEGLEFLFKEYVQSHDGMFVSADMSRGEGRVGRGFRLLRSDILSLIARMEEDGIGNEQDVLPEELTFAILTRVPAHLRQMRSVAKRWKSVISSAYFARAHLRLAQPMLLCRRVQYSKDPHKTHEFFSLHDPVTLEKLSEFSLRLKGEAMESDIIGCCNGVICLAEVHRRLHSITLCNPSIGRSASIEPPNYCKYDVSSSLFGYGCDSDGQNYRIIVLSTEPRLRCEVFLMKERRWIPVTFNLSFSSFRPVKMIHAGRCCGGTWVSGVLYWLVESSEKGRFLLSFNPSNCSFGHIMLPEGLSKIDSTVTILSNKTCLILLKYDFGKEETEITFWSFEGSWKQETVVHVDGCVRVVLILSYNDIMFQKSSKSTIYKWNTENKICREIPSLKELGANYVSHYIESLVLFEPKEDMSGTDCGFKEKKKNLETLVELKSLGAQTRDLEEVVLDELEFEKEKNFKLGIEMKIMNIVISGALADSSPASVSTDANNLEEID